MSFVDDLSKASQVFNMNATRLATVQHVGEATKVAQQMSEQLADGTMKDLEYRKNTNQLAKALQANLVKAGADANDIQLAFQAIGPKQYGSALEARQAGDTASADDMEMFDFKSREKRQVADFMRAKQLAEIKASAVANKAAKPKAITEGFMRQLDELDDTSMTFDSISQRLEAPGGHKLSGGFEGMDIIRSWRDQPFAQLKQDLNRANLAFKKAMTGTAGSTQELKFIAENSPNITDKDDILVKKVKNMALMSKVVKAKKLLQRAKIGQDVAGFGPDILAGQEAIEQLNEINGTKLSLDTNQQMADYLQNKNKDKLVNPKAPATGASKFFKKY